MTNQTVTTPSIYVSVLADYNSGYLHGAWIDATLSVDEIWQHINQLYISSRFPNVTATVCNECDYINLYEHDKCSSCDSSNIKIAPSAEEYAIHDYEGFEPFTLSEYSSIEEIADIAEMLSNVADDDDLAALTFLSTIYDDIATITAKIVDVNLYYGSRSEYAEQLISDICDVPTLLTHYIDYEKFGRDLELNGELVEVERDVYVTNAQDL
jgi:antirestriction protein